MIRALGQAFGYSNNARLLIVRNDFLQAQLPVAKNSDKCNGHDHLGLLENAIRRPQHRQPTTFGPLSFEIRRVRENSRHHERLHSTVVSME